MQQLTQIPTSSAVVTHATDHSGYLPLLQLFEKKLRGTPTTTVITLVPLPWWLVPLTISTLASTIYVHVCPAYTQSMHFTHQGVYDIP